MTTLQKVVTGKWLATAPHVLLLDEPTKGAEASEEAVMRLATHEPE